MSGVPDIHGEAGVDMNALVEFLVSRRKYLPAAMVQRLRAEFASEDPFSIMEIDLLAEVKQQLDVVRTLREAVVDGKRIIGAPKDVREALTASTSLLSLISKMYEDVVNMSRMRAVEMAVVDTLRETDEALVPVFMDKLKARLDSVH